MEVGKDDHLLTVPQPLAVPHPMIVLNPVVIVGVPGAAVGMIVSILSVVCVIVTACVAVAVTVTVSFSPLLLDVLRDVLLDLPPGVVDLDGTPGAPGVVLDVMLVPALLPGVAFDVVFGVLDVVVDEMKTPVVAVKDVFVPFVLGG